MNLSGHEFGHSSASFFDGVEIVACPTVSVHDVHVVLVAHDPEFMAVVADIAERVGERPAVDGDAGHDVPFFPSGFGCRFPAFEPRFFGIVACGLADGDGVDASVHGLDERFRLMESAHPILGLLRGEARVFAAVGVETTDDERSGHDFHEFVAALPCRVVHGDAAVERHSVDLALLVAVDARAVHETERLDVSSHQLLPGFEGVVDGESFGLFSGLDGQDVDCAVHVVCLL